MGWKIYFWVYAGLSVIGFLLYYSAAKMLNLGDWIAIVTTALASLAVYSYAYKKSFFDIQTWKILFIANLVWDIASILYSTTPLNQLLPLPTYLTPQINNDSSAMASIIAYALTEIPLIYVLYKLGYSEISTSKKKKK